MANPIYACTVQSADFGANHKSPILRAQITVRIDEGPLAGERVTYEEEVTATSAKFVGWSCSAVGWQGKSLSTLKTDVADWIARTGGGSTVEIKDIVTRKGTPEEGIWHKPNAIGKGASKPLRAADASALADADEAMRAAMGGAMGGAPDDDVPPPGDDDIPMITCGIRETSSVAAVLR